MSGIEIKYDMKFAETGNLYFEVAERTNPLFNFSPSGIKRKDNAWLYLIGNYERAFLFSKRQLISIHENMESYGYMGIAEKETATSKGFILPVSKIPKWLILKEFNF